MILVNGKVWTENPAQPTAQAVALDGPTILAVGDDAAIRKLAGPGAQVVDLGGRLLLPGFNDSHVHFLVGGESLITVQLRTANSRSEFQERIAQFAKSLPNGAWRAEGRVSFLIFQNRTWAFRGRKGISQQLRFGTRSTRIPEERFRYISDSDDRNFAARSPDEPLYVVWVACENRGSLAKGCRHNNGVNDIRRSGHA